MTDLKIKNIPGFDGVEFDFISPLEIRLDKPFPDTLFDQTGFISLNSIKATANKKFVLGKGAKKVGFEAGADGFTALGVYRKTDTLLDALKSEGMDEPIAKLPDLKIADDENLMVLRWGYNLKAAIDGKIALATAPVNTAFGATGETSGLFILLHTRKRNERVFESITETLKSWKIPRQIKTADDLRPKTTIAMETFGNIKMSIGVQYGYSYSWVRDKIKQGALSGEFGAKINAAVKAQFGYEAMGRYSIVLSRETRKKTIRVQVFKLKQNGMSFAFDAGISGQVEKHPFPKDLDSLIKGVFNLNGSQVLKDFEKWLDPNTKIEDLLGVGLVDEAKDLLKSVTGVDPDLALEDSVRKLKEVIKIWHELPNRFSSLIYDLLPQDLTELYSFLKKVNGFSGNAGEVSEKITNEIEKHLQDVEFYSTPVGKWLIEAAGGGITSFLSNFSGERKGFLNAVRKTLALLDGNEIEERFRNLQQYIDEKLHLDKIDNLTNTDEWLKKRLTEFLGNQRLINKDLKQIKKAITRLRSESDEFYKKGYAALTKKYGAEISYKFQKSGSSDALIDITFDFENGNKNALETHLKEALDGDFNELLTRRIKGVTLNKAVLTHEIKRNSHLEITLPFSKSVVSHINESIVRGEIIDEADGRLWLFNLEAEDILKKDKSLSKLAITGQFAVRFDDEANIRRFGDEKSRIGHSFLYAGLNVRRIHLESRYELAVDEYFCSEITSFSEYLTMLDKTLDDFRIRGSNNFGSVLTSLDLGLDGRVLDVWKKTPQDYGDDFYRQMSFAVQRRLRQWIPIAYIQDILQYEKEKNIYPLLTYMSLPPVSEPDDPRHRKKIHTRVFHWQYYKPAVKARNV